MTVSDHHNPTGFDFVARPDAQILILGSMPGIESIRQQQYYAHPRNSFWDLMGEMFAAGKEAPYPSRLLRLQQQHIALWDVASQCERSGSLDRNIRAGSTVPNNFTLFFANHPDIKAIFFNGQKAAQIYRRLVLPTLSPAVQALPLHTLPSTSPAHASLSREMKLKQWLKVREVAATLSR
ncbi:DNA-deoxyinosine glycosylase [Pseudomonadota bacterium]